MCILIHTIIALNIVTYNKVKIRFYECKKGLGYIEKQVPMGEVWLRRINGKNYYIFVPNNKGD